ncbi:hypothetical protein B0H14DRAFT_3491386 [Mycena olivaceomarginata]|nr:hypothetical protein B0H14DRAFT_3491386 [Mycena olivaceomarginata]
MPPKSAIHRQRSTLGRLRILGSQLKSTTRPGRAPLSKTTLGRKGIEDYRRAEEQSLRTRLQHMDVDGLEGLQHLQGLAEDEDFDPNNSNTPNMVNMGGVLNGSERIELSHAGGELGSLEEDLEEDTDDESSEAKTRKAEDWRTRRDRTERRNLAFESQVPDMVSSYIRYCTEQATVGGPLCAPRDEEETPVQEVYEIRVVDMFENIDRRSEAQAHGKRDSACPGAGRIVSPCAPWEPSVAIPVRVLEAYRIQHVRCPQLAIQSFVKSLCDMHGVAYRPFLCQQFSIAYDLYLDIRRRVDERLEGEDKLIFDMLTTMDRNDSLKRVLRRSKTSMADDEGGEPVLGRSKERVGEFGADNPCADRWKNMIEDVTSKMWGIFDETGIFLALCRHGFVLVIADMIRSGELAKYPLAIVEELLDTFGMNLGLGTTLAATSGQLSANSELGEKASRNNLKCLVGSFHGHAHNRLCQLSFLATYVEGMGLEDLEGCERYFSRSNGLAKSCRYASRFHRQQEITTYAKHFDSFETYANLSKVLVPALAILKTEPVLLNWMRQEGVDSYSRFHDWLREEKDYLLSLKDAPKTDVETLEMEYVQKLGKVHTVLLADARRARGDDAAYVPGTSKVELARRHGKEKVERDLESVAGAGEAAGDCRSLDASVAEMGLLIVERIFELTKMNRSQTGYKMRKHIAKALQARSKALTWEQVVEYAFLADFDILRDTRAEIQSRPWTRPAYRLAMDRYFKILRAREEIRRLNVEIPRVVTWIRDENRILRRKEAELNSVEGKTEEEAAADQGMAVQVRLYRERRGRFDEAHMRRFWALARTPGFTGSVMPECRWEWRATRREAQAQAAAQADGETPVAGGFSLQPWP